jgi:predicted nucleic acid-binding protein
MDNIQRSSSVYIDTNVFIYYIEASPIFFERAREIFERIDSVGARAVTSEVTLAECVYKPAQDGDTGLVGLYESLFEASGDVEMVPLDGGIAKRAGLRGGELGFKLIDAIHYLSALEAGCDLFVTSDARFKSGPALKVLRIEA